MAKYKRYMVVKFPLGFENFQTSVVVSDSLLAFFFALPSDILQYIHALHVCFYFQFNLPYYYFSNTLAPTVEGLLSCNFI